MEINEYFNNVYSRLKKYNFVLKNEKIDSFEIVFGTKLDMYSKPYEPRIQHSQNFVSMAVSDKITKDIVESLSRKCFDYSKNNRKKGFFISGTVSYTLLVSSEVDEEAKKFVQKKPIKRKGGVEVPVIFDLNENKIYYPPKMNYLSVLFNITTKKFVEMFFNLNDEIWNNIELENKFNNNYFYQIINLLMYILAGTFILILPQLLPLPSDILLRTLIFISLLATIAFLLEAGKSKIIGKSTWLKDGIMNIVVILAIYIGISIIRLNYGFY